MTDAATSNKVAVLGLGLMGGSLCLGLKRARFNGEVIGYARRQEVVDRALRDGVVEQATTDPAAAVREADLVVLCTPITTIPHLVEACREGLSPGAVLTDVGSTKVYLEATIPPLLEGTGATFVPSHPMCGSEKDGIEAADPELYEGATVVVVPSGDGADHAAFPLVVGLWKLLGSKVVEMDAALHDALVARTSHLPHLVSAALVAAVTREPVEDLMRAVCGKGLHDTSRVAGGRAVVWRDIVHTNLEPIRTELAAARAELDLLAGFLDKMDWDGLEDYLQRCADGRQELFP